MNAPPPDTPLDALRREIDAIDDQILGLLLRRFAATGKVKAAKAKDGSIAASPFRPAREAAMLRRLIGQGAGAVPPELLVRLWRVILSASTQSQAPVTLHMDASAGHDLDTRLAVARHFPGMAVKLHDTPAAALDTLNARRGDLAILAPAAQWAERFDAAGGARVIGTLPVIGEGAVPQLLLFGHAEPQPSGDDETLVIVPAAAAPAACLWQLRTGNLTLAGLPGFLAAEDPVLRSLSASLPGCIVAGRYPRPIKVSQ